MNLQSKYQTGETRNPRQDTSQLNFWKWKTNSLKGDLRETTLPTSAVAEQQSQSSGSGFLMWNQGPQEVAQHLSAQIQELSTGSSVTSRTQYPSGKEEK